MQSVDDHVVDDHRTVLWCSSSGGSRRGCSEGEVLSGIWNIKVQPPMFFFVPHSKDVATVTDDLSLKCIEYIHEPRRSFQGYRKGDCRQWLWSNASKLLVCTTRLYEALLQFSITHVQKWSHACMYAFMGGAFTTHNCLYSTPEWIVSVIMYESQELVHSHSECSKRSGWISRDWAWSCLASSKLKVS